jgi:hypothetical protein
VTEDQAETGPVVRFHAVVDRAGTAVVTTDEVATHLDVSREAAEELLATL